LKNGSNFNNGSKSKIDLKSNNGSGFKNG